MSAGVTLIVTALTEAVVHCHTGVKDKTFSKPTRFFHWYAFEIIQNAALQVPHFLETLRDEEGR